MAILGQHLNVWEQFSWRYNCKRYLEAWERENAYFGFGVVLSQQRFLGCALH